MLDLIIIGAGAAGVFAAICCEEQVIQPGRNPPRILVLERASQPLGKVLISGGGRCNLTHACFDPSKLVENYPRGGSALRGPFTRFQPKDTIEWFEQHGVALKTESDGRIFPVSDSSRTIVDCLLRTAKETGVEIRTHSVAASLETPRAPGIPFQVRLKNNGHREESLMAKTLLLATGGDRHGLQLATSQGHAIEPPVPSLFTFKVHDARLEGLTGITVSSARLRLLETDGRSTRNSHLEQTGALLVTHWGLSGPAVLRLSAWGARWLYDRNYQARLDVSWLGNISSDEMLAVTKQYIKTGGHARQNPFAHNPFPGLPQRLWKRLLEASGIPVAVNWGDVSKESMVRLAQELTQGQYFISGKGLFKDEFVTCGGVRLDEVDFKTMQSKVVPGLYFAGEILDIDGLTGGFNFQNAWTTGWIAGKAIASTLADS